MEKQLLCLSNSFFVIAENGTIKGSITGVPAANTADKLWSAFEALGDIAFAYPYSIILLEIQVWLPFFIIQLNPLANYILNYRNKYDKFIVSKVK